MNVARLTLSGAAAIAALIACMAPSASLAAPSGDAALEKFSTAWNAVQSYRCTITAHEVKGSDVQDRVYHLAFARPNSLRMDIVDGAGRGSAAVWQGGDSVYGHQGGFISFIKLHLNIHDSKAVSLRGTTIAQASFGALLDRFKALKTSSLDATNNAGKTTLTAAVADPATNQGVTKEVMIFGADNLPQEYDQFQGDQLVNRALYSEYQANPDLPASTWII